MSFRINSTGRKRLLREHVQIRLLDTSSSQPPAFTATINVPSDLGLPRDARIYVEPYVGSSSMRFDFGTVGSPISRERCVIADVDAGAAVLFRVKVVDESEGIGRILAAANGVRPENDAEGDDRKPLLPLRTMDLGEEIWRLDIDKDSGPTLCINNRIPGLAERLQSDVLLQGAIYPEVARKLLQFVWMEQAATDPSEAAWLEDWSDWFAHQLNRPLQEGEAEDDDAVQALADDVAAAFANRMKFASLTASMLGPGARES